MIFNLFSRVTLVSSWICPGLLQLHIIVVIGRMRDSFWEEVVRGTVVIEYNLRWSFEFWKKQMFLKLAFCEKRSIFLVLGMEICWWWWFCFVHYSTQLDSSYFLVKAPFPSRCDGGKGKRASVGLWWRQDKGRAVVGGQQKEVEGDKKLFCNIRYLVTLKSQGKNPFLTK